jgi:hypothetical protein
MVCSLIGRFHVMEEVEKSKGVGLEVEFCRCRAKAWERSRDKES